MNPADPMQLSYGELLRLYPMAGDFFSSYGLDEPQDKVTIAAGLDALDENNLREMGTSRELLADHFRKFIAHLADFDVETGTVHSMACLQHCPTQAIDCGRLTKNRTRYVFKPEN